MLAVLDGIGIQDEEEGNAVVQADTPNLDRLFSRFPYTELEAYGPAVGLPEGYIGNSEVGHIHLGAGRVIPQELKRINDAIEDGSFFENDTLKNAAEHATKEDRTVHVMGIASDGGVHGHLHHVLALIQFFAREGCEVRTHPFLDGRDVEPESAEPYLERIQEVAEATGTGAVASIMGRYYAMDRDGNWGRTEKAYRALVYGEGRSAGSVDEAMQTARREDRNDYFVEPTLVEGFNGIDEGDVIVFSNYRKDRARQLTEALNASDVDEFPVEGDAFHFVSMMPYTDRFDVPTVFDQQRVENTLGEVVSRAGVKQLRVSESQKEPHVTYFLDGQREERFPGTDVRIFPSADVDAYDEKPEMEASEITDHVVAAMEEGEHGFIFINYPNCDLVGHTGDLEAAVEAVETVDGQAGRLAEAATQNGYALVLTSDHGTAEELVGTYETSHTLNDVPLCVVGSDLEEVDGEGLSDVAPVVLELLDIPIPEEMRN